MKAKDLEPFSLSTKKHLARQSHFSSWPPLRASPRSLLSWLCESLPALAAGWAGLLGAGVLCLRLRNVLLQSRLWNTVPLKLGPDDVSVAAHAQNCLCMKWQQSLMSAEAEKTEMWLLRKSSVPGSSTLENGLKYPMTLTKGTRVRPTWSIFWQEHWFSRQRLYPVYLNKLNAWSQRATGGR